MVLADSLVTKNRIVFAFLFYGISTFVGNAKTFPVEEW